MIVNTAVLKKDIIKKLVVFFIIISMFTLLFVSFSSNTYTAVDGSTRSVGVFDKDKLYIHSNNHMLFPIHIYYFNKLLKVFDIESKDKFEYFKHSSILNAIAGAISLGIIFLILLKLTTSYFLSLLGVFLIGFSYTFMVSATNPNEIMTGFLLSILSVWLLFSSLTRKKIVYSFFSGLCLSYATATYQAMFSIFPPLILICLFYLVTKDKDKITYLKLMCSFLLSLFIGFVVIYGICYSVFYHINNIPDFIKLFFTFCGPSKGTRVIFRLKNFITIFFGFTQSIFKLPYYGLRATFFGDYCSHQIYLLWTLPIMMIGSSLIFIYRGFINIIKHDNKYLYTSFALFLFFIFSSSCLFYVSVAHTKLWLQPIAAYTVLGICITANYMRLNINRKKKRFIITYLLGFLTILMFWNINNVLIPNHKGEPEVMKSVRSIENITEENSLVFTDWDKVSLTFRDFFRGKRLILTVPTLALDLDEKSLINKIDEAIQEAKNQKQNIYFLGILSTSKERWNDRRGISYESFQKYRDCTTVIKKFLIGENEYVLYKYTTPVRMSNW